MAQERKWKGITKMVPRTLCLEAHEGVSENLGYLVLVSL